MDGNNKFAAETVHKLQQSLDEVAPYQATELSKQQAIGALSPQIRSLRAKGYSWTAVAAMLTEHGVPVSVAALRTYLRRIREGAADEAPRTPARRLRDARAVAAAASPLAPSPTRLGETTSAAKPPKPGAVAASPVAAQPATVPGTRREPEPRRSAVEVKPGKDDI
jgi:hypothetical protein